MAAPDAPKTRQRRWKSRFRAYCSRRSPAGIRSAAPKAFASRSWKENFEAAVNAWGATFELPTATTAVPATNPAKNDRHQLEDYAIKNMDLPKWKLMEMDDEELWQRVQHDL